MVSLQTFQTDLVQLSLMYGVSFGNETQPFKYKARMLTTQPMLH
jgi:hypothetical protein